MTAIQPGVVTALVVLIAEDGSQVGWKFPIGNKVHEGVVLDSDTEYEFEPGVLGRARSSRTTTTLTITTDQPYSMYVPEQMRQEIEA